MPERDFPPKRQQPFSELQGILAQVQQQWSRYRIGLILTTDSDFYRYVKQAIPESKQSLPALEPRAAVP